jgi:hypothetical protein
MFQGISDLKQQKLFIGFAQVYWHYFFYQAVFYQ